MFKSQSKIYSELLEISEKSFYRWRSKDHVKLLSLLEKYLTKEDIEEFLIYGYIEKFESKNFINNSRRASRFINVIDSINNGIKFLNEEQIHNFNLGVDYLAYIFAKSDFNNAEHAYKKNGIVKRMLYKYDDFLKIMLEQNYEFNSSLLGSIIDSFLSDFADFADFENIILDLHEKDFVTLVKVCLRNKPNSINNVLRFCIKYNMYRYNINLNYENILDKVYKFLPEERMQIFPDGKKIDLDYDKFKEEMNKLQRNITI